MNQKTLIKSFSSLEAKIKIEREKTDLNVLCSAELTSTDPKYLIHKVDPTQPGSLTSEVKRLIAKCFQNTQEWIKEQKQKEEVEQEEVKKLISEVWNKEPIKDYGNN